MKFCKQYTAYMRSLESSFLTGFSFVQLKRLKQVLKKCRRDSLSFSDEADCQHSRPQLGQMGESQLYLSSEVSSPQSFDDLESASAKPASSEVETSSINPERANCCMECSVCDGTFFPLLLNEVAAVAACFNARVRQLLRFRIASGFQKYLLRLKYKQQFMGNQLDMAQEGKYLVGYACMNALAIRKILKKYDKVHYSRKGRAFKTRLQTLHVEILQSPWLIELIALHINLKESLCTSPEILEDCSSDFGANNPVISCTLRNSLKMEVDLSCSICLEMVFDPVALGCGHIFCKNCACCAASIPTVQGLKAAMRTSKCPLCRQPGVYSDAVFLTEVGILISTRFKTYWSERLKRERVERLQQAKEHWDNQCRTFVGL